MITTEQITESSPDRFEISVAPMMDWTDRHCRMLHRLISSSVKLYTEMVTTGALIHGDTERHLRYDEAEHPVALQLGGSDPSDLAACAKIADQWGYDEINLNCGCPSDRVQKGRFGACLMAEPDLVANCIKAMQDRISKPVTVKCRIGIDHSDEQKFLNDFILKIAESGCHSFIVHARKAWLQGLSPKENREVPPLNYQRVYDLKKDFPHLQIIINGGITSIEDIRNHLLHIDGVMIGRAAYQNPWLLREVEHAFSLSQQKQDDELAVVHAFLDYAATQIERYETPLHSMTRHMTGLFQGKPGARKWRQTLSTVPKESNNDVNFIRKALETLQFDASP